MVLCDDNMLHSGGQTCGLHSLDCSYMMTKTLVLYILNFPSVPLSFWFFKFLVLVGITVGAFFIPDGIFTTGIQQLKSSYLFFSLSLSLSLSLFF